MNTPHVPGSGRAGLVGTGEMTGVPSLLGRKSVLAGMAASMGFVLANAAQPSATAAGTVKAIAATQPAYVLRWTTSTTYAFGQQVVSPNNDVVSATVAHTSSATFATDSVKWALSPTFARKDSAFPLGSAENPVTDTAAARPSGIPVVYWVTASEPVNAANGDIVSLPSAGGGMSSVVVLTGSDPSALHVTQNNATDAQQFAIFATDNAANPGTLFRARHYGVGYGFDVQSLPGASSGLVVQHYSAVAAGVQFDNTASQPMLTIRNTQNAELSPGTMGSGPYFDLFGDLGTVGTPNLQRLGQLDKDLIFQSHNATRPWTFKTAFGIVAPSLLVTQSEAAAGLEIQKSGAGSFIPALLIGNSAPGPGLSVQQSGTDAAISVSMNGSAANYYPMVMTGGKYGPNLSTSMDNGETLSITKNGTGAGRGIVLTNKGTGNSLEIADGTSTRFAITPAGLPKWATGANVQTTVGAAGAASAPPTAPQKYLKIVGDDGVTYVVPAYKAF